MWLGGMDISGAGSGLLGIAFNGRPCETSGNKGLIYVLDTSTNRVVKTIQTDYPGGLAITHASRVAPQPGGQGFRPRPFTSESSIYE